MNRGCANAGRLARMIVDKLVGHLTMQRQNLQAAHRDRGGLTVTRLTGPGHSMPLEQIEGDFTCS